MSEMDRGVYGVFQKHYRNLEIGLPFKSMYSILVTKGLLNDTQLRERVKGDRPDTISFLDSFRRGLRLGNSGEFEKLLDVMEEYATECDDAVVRKLTEDIRQDLRYLTSQPPRSTCDNLVKPAEALDAYYNLLINSMDAKSFGGLMVAKGLISQDDLDAIIGAPSDYMRNSYLLEHVNLLKSSEVLTFFTLLQESSNEMTKAIGDHYLKELKDYSASDGSESDDNASPVIESDDSSTLIPSPVGIGVKRKQPEEAELQVDKSVKHMKVSRRYSTQFAQLLQKLYKLLWDVEAGDMILVLTQLFINKSSNISLFSQKELEDCSKCKSVTGMLRRLRHCWSWHDHSILKILIQASHTPEAVKLLDDFDSSISASQPLSAYPIPIVSSSLAFDGQSSYTILATRHEEDFCTFSLQNVSETKSMLLEKFELAEHCMQLVAVKSNPSALFWMIPKHVASAMCGKVHEHSDFLCAQKILEVAIYPNTMIVTDHNLSIGLLSFLSGDLKEAKVGNIQTLLSQVKDLPDLLWNLQSDLAKSTEETCALQLKSEELQITSKINQETESKEASILKVTTELQEEELSETQSRLLIIKTENVKLQNLNKLLTKKFAELKLEKNALNNKLQSLEKEISKLNEHLMELETELSKLKAQENVQYVKQLQIDAEEKDQDISSLKDTNRQLKSTSEELQRKVDIMWKDINLLDHPTIEEISLIVLPQQDIVRNWSSLKSVLLGGRGVPIESTATEPAQLCFLVFEKWLNSPHATWSALLDVLQSLNLRSAYSRISSLLPGYRRVDSHTFHSCNSIDQAFQKLTSHVTSILKVSDFYAIRRACIVHSNSPAAARLPPDFAIILKSIGNVDSLIDELAFANLWTWLDTRLMEAMAAASILPTLSESIEEYKQFAYSKKLSSVLTDSTIPSLKQGYIKKVSLKVNASPYEICVADLIKFKNALAGVIMDINEGSLTLERIDEGCIEVHCHIPIHLFAHAYQSSLKKVDKFSSFHIRYIHFEGYSKIYSMRNCSGGVTVPLPSNELCPNEVARFYHQFLIERMDSDSVSHVMASKKLLSSDDVNDINRSSSNTQRNNLILNHVLLMDTAELFSFSEVLLEMEHQHYIGEVLVKALRSAGISKHCCYPSVPRPLSIKYS